MGKRQYRREDEKREIIARIQSALTKGSTVVAACEAEGIARTQYQEWCKRLGVKHPKQPHRNGRGLVTGQVVRSRKVRRGRRIAKVEVPLVAEAVAQTMTKATGRMCIVTDLETALSMLRGE